MDFNITFNPRITSPIKKIYPNLASFNSEVCSGNIPSMTQQVISGSVRKNFIASNISQNIDDIVGIAIDGVPIMPAVSKYNKMDLFYPRPWDGSNANYTLAELDTCMGSVDPSTKTYSYRTLPSCLTKDYIGNVDPCLSSVDCFNDLRNFALNQIA